MKEIWKDIPEYLGYYQVSNKGRVRSLTRTIKASRGNGTRTMQGRILVNIVDEHSYLKVQLSYKGKVKKHYVHRLMAKQFIPNLENKPYINHIDFDRTNCTIDNLEWCSQKENISHSRKAGRYPDRKGIRNVKQLKPVYGINVKTGERIDFDCCQDARDAGYTNTMRSLKEGTNCKGYKFYYK